MKLEIPELCLVVLVGVTGSGKTSFAAKHFRPTEVLSSDFFRAMVRDDANDQAATRDAFDALTYVAAKRLAAGRLTVVDATNVQLEARKPLVELARQHDCLPAAIVLNVDEDLCRERNRLRPDRAFGPHVVRQQAEQLRRSLRQLRQEGFRYVFVLSSLEDIEVATIERVPLWVNRTWDHGPFDIIGDVHGCFDELMALLDKLGYRITQAGLDGDGQEGTYQVEHPQGRRPIFLGDLVDRGPDSPGVLRLVMDLVRSGAALCLPGNHEVKLVRKLKGRNVSLTHGLPETLEQLSLESDAFVQEVASFLDGLVSHYVLDDGKLVVAHAGLREEYQGRASARVRDFCLFGETTGETDEFGLPVRYNWAANYRGPAMVVYGHVPVVEPEWTNRTIDIDTGCVFGGKLTSLRYPENELISVPAARVYYEPIRPLVETSHQDPTVDSDTPPATQSTPGGTRPYELLDIQDVLGKRVIETVLRGRITIREENAAAALEVMSRYAVDPRWLVYLPPTMSPCETADQPGFLEHPEEAFRYFQRSGIGEVVCEGKHMGSRAIVIVCRDASAARRRFGVDTRIPGICYTRTGRPFFEDAGLEAELLQRVGAAAQASGIWEELATDWMLLDCEIMPWSLKAQELLLQQYASVGAAARIALRETLPLLEQAIRRGVDTGDELERHQGRLAMAERYAEAYGRYCWQVESLADIRLAPFHLLATEGAVHSSRDHSWHLELLGRLGASDPALLVSTAVNQVNVNDSESVRQGTEWWEDLVGRGGEGMVVKPMQFIARGKNGLAQPAVKCRGPEYLRIIYGPEYDVPANLERLRARSLGRKRSLALREFALGMEGINRFVNREPLYRVHECVFGVLALESEPVDPRL
jgi:protein phosphatase